MSSPRTLRALGILIALIALIAIYLAVWQVDQVAAALTRSIGLVGVALIVAANHLKGRRQRVQRELLDDHQRKLLTQIWCATCALLLTLGASIGLMLYGVFIRKTDPSQAKASVIAGVVLYAMTATASAFYARKYDELAAASNLARPQ